MKVQIYDIKYKGNDSILHVTGPAALQQYVSQGVVNRYSKKTAPKTFILDIPETCLESDGTLNLAVVKKFLEKEVILEVEDFNCRYYR